MEWLCLIALTAVLFYHIGQSKKEENVPILSQVLTQISQTNRIIAEGLCAMTASMRGFMEHITENYDTDEEDEGNCWANRN